MYACTQIAPKIFSESAMDLFVTTHDLGAHAESVQVHARVCVAMHTFACSHPGALQLPPSLYVSARIQHTWLGSELPACPPVNKSVHYMYVYTHVYKHTCVLACVYKNTHVRTYKFT